MVQLSRLKQRGLHPLPSGVFINRNAWLVIASWLPSHRAYAVGIIIQADWRGLGTLCVLPVPAQFRKLMVRSVFFSLIALLLVVPANAKPKRDVYPISCDELWTAVKKTLNSPGNYGVLSVNDLTLHASFNVIGDLVKYTDRVTLIEQNGGCKMDLQMLQVGSDNSDERGFRKRLKRTLATIEHAKPLLPEEPKSAASMGQQ